MVDGAWPAGGRALCTATGGQSSPTIVSDGAGGAIVSWSDGRLGSNSDIYAQHVLASGAVDPSWPADGRALCTATGAQFNQTSVSDGAGGAIVTWQDSRGTTNYDIYAQRVLASGAVDPAWPANGRAICTAIAQQVLPIIIADGAGGAIITWYDHRNLITDHVYAQHVLITGAVDAAWPADGRELLPTGGNQQSPTLVGDGAGGAIVTWTNNAGGGATTTDVYAQHVLSTGAVDPAWPAASLAVCSAASNQVSPTIVTDGAAGAIVTWYDQRNNATSGRDIYAQHVLSSGAVDPAWPVNGRALCTATGDQYLPAMLTDGMGGAFVTWQDLRDDATQSYDVYAHHVLSSGAVDGAWPANGRGVCTAGGLQGVPAIVTDGSGGIIVGWEDHRGADFDIYALELDPFGNIVAVTPGSRPERFDLLSPFPNPARNDRVTIRFDLPVAQPVSAEVLDVAGHRVRTLALDRQLTAGRQSLAWDGRDGAGALLTSGVYFICVRTGANADMRRIVMLR